MLSQCVSTHSQHLHEIILTRLCTVDAKCTGAFTYMEERSLPVEKGKTCF